MIVKALDPETWPAYARLIEKHNGVWGGCWCLGFHQKGTGSFEQSRDVKHQLVCEGKSKAAVVFDGENAIGWCNYGRRELLPRIKHKKRYATAVQEAADWRITCFFIDRDYRGRGVAQIALNGALELIALEGGGLVESFPEDASGRKTSGAFLYNATLSIFDRAGFDRIEKIGMHHWLVTKLVNAQA